MIIYVYPKCSTCQEALKFLKERNISVVVKDIVKEPPSVQELEQMLAFQKGQLTKILNTSGQLYREMGLAQKVKEQPVEETLRLMSQKGMLIKRPFLLGKSWGLVGFKEDIWSKIWP